MLFRQSTQLAELRRFPLFTPFAPNKGYERRCRNIPNSTIFRQSTQLAELRRFPALFTPFAPNTGYERRCRKQIVLRHKLIVTLVFSDITLIYIYRAHINVCGQYLPHFVCFHISKTINHLIVWRHN